MKDLVWKYFLTNFFKIFIESFDYVENLVLELSQREHCASK